MPTLKLTGALGLFCVVLASACTDSSPSVPTSPSAVSSSGSSAQAGAVTSSASSAAVATVSGPEVSAALGNGHGNGNGGGNGNGHGNPNVNGGGNGNGNGNGPPATPGPITSKKVEIEGLISAIAGNVLTVNGQNVVVPLTVIVHHGSHLFDFTDLEVGDRVHIRARLVSELLTASEVKLQNPGDQADEEDDGDDDGDDNQILIQGLIVGLTVGESCPARTFTMGSTLVHTSADTVYVDATCPTLVNGAKVKVTGTIQDDTSLLAAKVEVVP
jgi:Domain of unknown function (DUF5666)